MPYKRKCKLCNRDYGHGIAMVKLTRSWLCMGCFTSIMKNKLA